MMGDRKGTTVLLTVIGIATLLVTLVGATFAYFTATVNDENAGQTDVTVTAATLGTITFTHGDVLSLDNAYPGDSATNTFTVKSAAESTVAVDYKVYLVVTENTFETANLLATLSGTSSHEAGTAAIKSNLNATALEPAYGSLSGEFATGKKVEIGSGSIQPAGAQDTWTLTVELDEIGTAQNADQGKAFKAQIVVEATLGYTAGGSTTVTNAQ